jgi:hypothetical protein
MITGMVVGVVVGIVVGAGNGVVPGLPTPGNAGVLGVSTELPLRGRFVRVKSSGLLRGSTGCVLASGGVERGAGGGVGIESVGDTGFTPGRGVTVAGGGTTGFTTGGGVISIIGGGTVAGGGGTGKGVAGVFGRVDKPPLTGAVGFSPKGGRSSSVRSGARVEGVGMEWSTVPHDSRQFVGFAVVVSTFVTVGAAGGSRFVWGPGLATGIVGVVGAGIGCLFVCKAQPLARGETGEGAFAWPLNTRIEEPSVGS